MQTKAIHPVLGQTRCSRWLRTHLLLAGLALSSTVQAALIGFYPFDGPNPQDDASPLGRDLQSVAADPTHQPAGGLEGGAYYFDGTQRLIAPIDINPGTLPQMTMGAWVKTASLTPGLRKFIGSDDGGWDRSIGLDDRNGPFRYTSFTGSGPAVGTPGPVSTNHWTFFAVTYDTLNGRLSMYIDLDSVSSEPLAPVTVPASFGSGFLTVAIGAIRPDVQAEGWVGSMDNAFFFDEVLSLEQITAIRDGGRSAILGLPGDDPNLRITSTPALGNLPKVPNVKTLSFAILNSGSAQTLDISSVTLAGVDASYYTIQSFPATLGPGGSGTIEIRFDSQGQVGVFYATATITSDDPGSPSVLLDLTATVAAAQTLLGFYSFDDSANPLSDASGANRTLVNGLGGGTADPTYLPGGGFVGGAFEFNSTHRLVAPININPTVEPRLAMGAWVKTASLVPGERKVLGHDDGAWDRVIGLDTRVTAEGGPMAAGTLRYAAFTGLNNHGPTQGDPPPTPISTETWTFLAVDYDQANNRVSLYVDLDASTTGDDLQLIERPAPMGPGANTVGIGAISPNGNEGWIGAIDNVFFVRGALDAATMRAVRDGGPSTLLQFGPDPALAVLTDPVFGDLTNGATRTVQIQIRNGGASQPLNIVRARVTGRDAARYSVGPLPGPIAPGATAILSVTLTPQGRQGVLVAMLELTSNDSGNRIELIDLTASIPFSDPSAALIGFYTFDDPANPLRDESSRGNHLSLVAGAEPALRPGEGFRDGAYQFAGAQRLIAPININPAEKPALTMGAWVKFTDSSGLRKVIGSDDGGWDRTIGIDNRDDGITRYTTFIGNGPPLRGTPTPSNPEAWSFIAATYNQVAGQVVMYVDLDATTTDDPLVAVSGPTGFGSGFPTTAIGGIRPDNANEGWSGWIDNVFFYEKVLTADELTTLRDRELALADELKILSITRDATSLTITWRSRAGEFYNIEYKERLDQSWQFIAIEGAVGRIGTFTDSDPDRLARPTGFYRVVGE